MVFSSLEFLFLFLPIFLLIYFLIPSRFRNLILFAGSVVFYSMGTLEKPVYILLIVGSMLVNYLVALGMARFDKCKKLFFILGVIYNFAWLFVFKYSDFMFSGVNEFIAAFLPKVEFRFKMLGLLLPIGISFYTFQSVSYIADVYKGKCEAERSFINLGAYICMFPQLIAGPIVTYASVREQLHAERKFSLVDFSEGIKTFVFGLGLKVILANQLGNLWSTLSTIGYESVSTPLAWLGLIAYTFQIYFDFYGYSLMALGLGKIIGFNFPDNFNHPYISCSMTEFWRRWHITLGSWFREYVYIPLGGSRVSKPRMIFNLFVVWIFTGLWHGASLNFVLWGLVLFLFIMIEKLFLKKYLDKYKWFGHIYMIILIPLSWALFAITDFSQLAVFFGRLFPFITSAESQQLVIYRYDFIKYAKEFGMLLVAGVFFSTEFPYKLLKKYKDSIFETVFLLAAFYIAVYCMYKGLNDPFLYFRF
ncbi:MAG: MBOAT family protein [Lachnospiraceae bacterium]|nr:MBOAT family protein [Lachnospiraceae bacterium]